MAKPEAKLGPSLLKKDAGGITIQKRAERTSGLGLFNKAIRGAEALLNFGQTLKDIAVLTDYISKQWGDLIYGTNTPLPELQNKECDTEHDCYEIAVQLRDLVQVQRTIAAQNDLHHRFYVERCKWDMLAHDEHMKALSNIADKVERLEKRVEQTFPPAEEWSELACDIRQSIESSASVLAARIAQHHHGLTGNKLPGLQRESGTCNKVKIWDSYTPLEGD